MRFNDQNVNEPKEWERVSVKEVKKFFKQLGISQSDYCIYRDRTNHDFVTVEGDMARQMLVGYQWMAKGWYLSSSVYRDGFYACFIMRKAPSTLLLNTALVCDLMDRSQHSTAKEEGETA